MKWYVWIVTVLLWSWCVVSLLSYDPRDPSSWYMSTESAVVHNRGGVIGAELAAWLIGICAVSIWFFVTSATCMLLHYGIEYTALSDLSYRMFLIGLLVLVVDAHVGFCTYQSVVPGGALGLELVRFASVYMSPFSVGSMSAIFVSSCVWWILPKAWRLCAIRYSIRSLQRGFSCVRVYLNPFRYRVYAARKKVCIDIPSESLMDQDCVVDASTKEVAGRSYMVPPLAQLLHRPVQSRVADMEAWCREKADILRRKLSDMGIEGAVVSWSIGPVLVQFAYQPERTVPVRKILAAIDDIALALKTTSVDILSPIPGTTLVGITVARDIRMKVHFFEGLDALREAKGRMELPLLLGVDTNGLPVCADLASFPHLLVAGSTGSGKSVVLHCLLMSLVSYATPRDCRLILIDPKRLEFAWYHDIAHLITPVITDSHAALHALRWVVKEMERRYEILSESAVQDCVQYRLKHPDKELPSLVVVIDEWADLMMTGGKEAEHLAVRIAQMARAAGIHIIIATQRPSVDVVTGLLKVNIPVRIACKVASKIDSRTILDQMGAERLLGRGDMLCLMPSYGIRRLQGVFISSEELQKVLTHIRAQADPLYVDLDSVTARGDRPSVSEVDMSLYHEALALLKTVDAVSISLFQRKFRIGYNRSARLIDVLEHEGYILPSDGSKMRKVVKQSYRS